MEKWKEIEFYYAKRLRQSSAPVRKALYKEAYSFVSNLAIQRFISESPEDRTAGTSKRLVELLSQIVDKNDDVLEIGCGRGYTCLKLSPYVKSIIGVEVSEPSASEANKIIAQRKIQNVKINQVSAFELDAYFGKNEFDVCLSIDVVEHLHPEDAKEHLQQVFEVLKPGGKYVIVMPNRLSGPHDITREEFPEAITALGFHLNESTYRDMRDIMSSIGFNKFRSFYETKKVKSLIKSQKDIKPLALPIQLNVLSEILYKRQRNLFRCRIFENLISIRLIGYKPES